VLILGINDSHDAGVCLLEEDGGIRWAASEERFTRVKQQWGFPRLALEACLQETGTDPSDIAAVAFGFQGLIETAESSSLPKENPGRARRMAERWSPVLGPLVATSLATAGLRLAFRLLRRNRDTNRQALRELGIMGAISYRDHHRSHAASAYYTGPFSEATVLTIDAGGDGLSGSVWRGQGGRLRRVAAVPRIHSVGDMWLYVTHICGFDPDRHGGKVTGLAAHGSPSDAVEILQRYFRPDPRRLRLENRRHLFWRPALRALEQDLAGISREDLAFAAQRLLEEAVTGIAREAVRRTGLPLLALAGGVFANVKLNMEIQDLPEVEGIYVHPHMGDGGVGTGAAYLALAGRRAIEPGLQHHVFLGSHPGAPGDLEGLVVDSPRDLAASVAEEATAGRVIGLVRGAMEYGPRALLHRTILYRADDPSVNDWLNQRLKRTEFMPFAPVVTEDSAPGYFLDMDCGAEAARFMTTCFRCTERAKNKADGVVHVDGTARPQVIYRNVDSFSHRILTEYGRRTGEAILVNTSFNRHEEPILRTADQAVEELRLGTVDVLGASSA